MRADSMDGAVAVENDAHAPPLPGQDTGLKGLAELAQPATVLLML